MLRYLRFRSLLRCQIEPGAIDTSLQPSDFAGFLRPRSFGDWTRAGAVGRRFSLIPGGMFARFCQLQGSTSNKNILFTFPEIFQFDFFRSNQMQDPLSLLFQVNFVPFRSVFPLPIVFSPVFPLIFAFYIIPRIHLHFACAAALVAVIWEQRLVSGSATRGSVLPGPPGRGLRVGEIGLEGSLGQGADGVVDQKVAGGDLQVLDVDFALEFLEFGLALAGTAADVGAHFDEEPGGAPVFHFAEINVPVEVVSEQGGLALDILLEVGRLDLGPQLPKRLFGHRNYYKTRLVSCEFAGVKIFYFVSFDQFLQSFAKSSFDSDFEDLLISRFDFPPIRVFALIHRSSRQKFKFFYSKESMNGYFF